MDERTQAGGDLIFFMIDKEYRYVFFNKQHAETMKAAYDVDIETGKNLLDFISSPHESKRVRKLLDRAINAEVFSDVMIILDQAPMYFEAFYSPVFNEKQEVTGASVTAHDITDRKKMEISLKTSEERFADIIFSIADWVWEVDDNGRYTFCSPRVFDFLGLTPENVIGKTPFDFMQEEEAKRVGKIFSELIENKAPLKDLENWIFNSRGEKKCLLTNAVPIIDKEGKLRGYRGVDKDITDRRNSEMRREQELLFANSLKNIAEVIIFRDKAEDILQDVNRLIGETLKLDRSLIYDVSFDKNCITALCEWLRIDHPDIEVTRGDYPIDMFREPFSEILKSGKFLISHSNNVGEAFTRDDSGKILHEGFKIKSLIWYPFAFDNQGYHVFTLNQILEHREWTRQEFEFLDSAVRTVSLALMKIQLLDEKEKASLELIRARDKAEESDRLKSAFLANMSHEIRTPMNGILGFAQLLKEPKLSGDEQQEYIRIIQKSGARMLKIINDIVSISKIESGQMDVSVTETNIFDLFEFIQTFFHIEVQKKGLQFSVQNSLSHCEGQVWTDTEKLYAILINLVSNAIKNTQHGFIIIGAEKKGEWIEFYVKDSGSGIPGNQIEVIFERFRQGSDFKSQYTEGAGLGLSISKAYVEMLGGNIRVESEPGKGSIFYFTIPNKPVNRSGIAVEEPTAVNAADKQTKSLKILVVEDDEDSQNLIRIVFDEFGKEFLSASSGIEAIEVCKNNPDINLILMDIRMPEMDGYEATRQIRKFNQDVIIIAQTAYGLSGDREKAERRQLKQVVMNIFQNLLLLRNLKASSKGFSKILTDCKLDKCNYGRQFS